MAAVGIILGLTAALVYGASDFLGGAASKRVSALWVLLASQATGLVLTVLVVVVDVHSHPSTAGLRNGAIAGVVGVAALALLYTALAIGPMVVIAPMAAVVGALVPFAWGLLRGEQLSAAALTGVVLAVGAVVLVSMHPRGDTAGEPVEPRRFPLGVPLALVAGAALGVAAVLVADTASATGLWPLVSWRVCSLPLVAGAVLVVRPRPRPDSRILVVGAAVGALEVLGNASFILAARHGLLALVGVLASLYPVSTVVLARLRYQERLVRLQVVGLALAVTGIALIAA
jgi:drug/metabolite transporter (DMT)-like permease